MNESEWALLGTRDPGFPAAKDIVSGKLRRITYKPGWTFDLWGLMIRFEFYVVPSGRDDTRIERPHDPDYLFDDGLRSRYHSPLRMTQSVTRLLGAHQCAEREIIAAAKYDDVLVMLLHRAIEQADHHERDEFLRLDGHQVRDPHPELHR